MQAVEDKTFGLKNKKGAKGQKIVQQVKQSIDATAAKKSGCACHARHHAPSLMQAQLPDGHDSPCGRQPLHVHEHVFAMLSPLPYACLNKHRHLFARA